MIDILAGGGGSPAPLAEAVAEVTALGGLVLAAALGIRITGIGRSDPVLASMIAAVLLFPLVQLLPVPPGWWQLLPGRQGVAAALAATGQDGRWQPWSLMPDATLAGALALVPAAVLMALAATMSVGDRVRLIAWLAVLGCAAALLGLVQFMRGPDAVLSLFAEVHRGWGIGFFANRSAQADLLAIVLVAGLLLVGRYRDLIAPSARVGLLVVGFLISIAGVATGSRMGMVAMMVPVVLATVQVGRHRWRLGLAVAGGAALLLVGGTALDRVTARVHDGGARAEIWGDSVYVARSLAPVGGGVGSFEPLYAAAERLDHVQPSIANRAHNDFLELAIEGGVPALVLLVALLVLIARRVVAGWRDRDPDRRLLARFAGLTTLILMLHSSVDYPLRTITLLSVAGLALAGLASSRRAPHKADGAGTRTDVYA